MLNGKLHQNFRAAGPRKPSFAGFAGSCQINLAKLALSDVCSVANDMTIRPRQFSQAGAAHGFADAADRASSATLWNHGNWAADCCPI
jgi:hypothetical protein